MVFVMRKLSTVGSLAAYIPKPLTHQPVPPHRRRLQEDKEQVESHLVAALDGCTNLTQIHRVHSHILTQGLNQSCHLITKLIRALTRINTPIHPYPLAIFHQVHYPNPFLYTALIRGYLIQGRLSEAVSFYGLMRREGVRPVSFTFAALFKSCGTLQELRLGRQLHAQTVVVGGFGNDLYVGNTMMEMYLKCGVLESARGVFDEMPERDVISWTELIVGCANVGDMRSACELFDGLPVKDIVAWTAMVKGFLQNGRPREAIEYFKRMQEFGVGNDEFTLSIAISACAQLGAANYADWIGRLAEESGFSGVYDVVVGSALIDMYSKCGMVEEAYRVFWMMKERNVYTYTSMIMGFAIHGRGHAAIELFDEMVMMGVKPNTFTFISVLTACNHARLIEKGLSVFESMEKLYGIEPSVGHYACMVGMLGRIGQLDEALNLVKSMPIQSNAELWGALLGACRVHKNPDVAELAACQLFELEPNNVGNYITLFNIYASVGRWHDASMVRKMIRAKGLTKNHGCSWLETKNGIFHEFLASEIVHPKSSEIKQALEYLLNRLEAEGYKPNLDCVPYDVSDGEKQRILMNHSEKQALAFGLIDTEPGSSIRIMKNVRICEDCHLVMCMASHVMEREIVVRDTLRFHHFRDGTCSCDNFW